MELPQPNGPMSQAHRSCELAPAGAMITTTVIEMLVRVVMRGMDAVDNADDDAADLDEYRGVINRCR